MWAYGTGVTRELSQEHREFRKDKILLWLDPIIMANVLPSMLMSGAVSLFTVGGVKKTAARESRSPISKVCSTCGGLS
jgi:hypothetical protein